MPNWLGNLIEFKKWCKGENRWGKGGSESPAGSRRAWNLHLNWIHKTPPPRGVQYTRHNTQDTIHKTPPPPANALRYCFGKIRKYAFQKHSLEKYTLKTCLYLGLYISIALPGLLCILLPVDVFFLGLALHERIARNVLLSAAQSMLKILKLII